MNDSISILEQLVTAIEQAGVYVAPTYQEYMPLAFARWKTVPREFLPVPLVRA